MTKHKTDTNSDGLIDMMELIAFITRWKANATDITKPEAKNIWFRRENNK